MPFGCNASRLRSCFVLEAKINLTSEMRTTVFHLVALCVFTEIEAYMLRDLGLYIDYRNIFEQIFIIDISFHLKKYLFYFLLQITGPE